MTIAITIAKIGIMARTPLILPRVLGSVTSTSQVLNAASFAVEPKKVIMQSNITSIATTPAPADDSKFTGIAAKSIMVAPQII